MDNKTHLSTTTASARLQQMRGRSGGEMAESAE